MTMDNMVKRFEAAGFECNKRYLKEEKAYEFTISKDGMKLAELYKWNAYVHPAQRDKEQSAFISDLIRDFNTTHKNRSSHKETIGDLFKRLTAEERNAMYYVVGEALHESVYPKIEKVIFNPPATIVLWSDNTKTVVKCQDGDIYDPEKGLAMAISKKYLGNKGNYCEVFKKWVGEYEARALEEYNENAVSEALGKLQTAASTSWSKVQADAKELLNEIFDGPGEPIRVREGE